MGTLTKVYVIIHTNNCVYTETTIVKVNNSHQHQLNTTFDGQWVQCHFNCILLADESRYFR